MGELLNTWVDLHGTDSGADNRSALHGAAAAGSEAAVRALARTGAVVGALDARGWAPLQCACSCGHRGVVVFLLFKGTCTHKGPREQDPPPHLAAINNRTDVIEGLLFFRNVSIGSYADEADQVHLG